MQNFFPWQVVLKRNQSLSSHQRFAKLSSDPGSRFSARQVLGGRLGAVAGPGFLYRRQDELLGHSGREVAVCVCEVRVPGGPDGDQAWGKIILVQETVACARTWRSKCARYSLSSLRHRPAGEVFAAWGVGWKVPRAPTLWWSVSTANARSRNR